MRSRPRTSWRRDFGDEREAPVSGPGPGDDGAADMADKATRSSEPAITFIPHSDVRRRQ